MAPKKKHEEHVNHERWLVSYADFITLLFAFFVVLFSAANADKQKVGQIAKAIQEAFSRHLLFTNIDSSRPGGAIRIRADDMMPLNTSDGSGPKSNKKLIKYTNPKFLTQNNVILRRLQSVPFGEITPADNINEAYEKIKQMIVDAKLDAYVHIEKTKKGIRAVILSTELFESGSERLGSGGNAIVDRIGAILKQIKNYILIESYTDNQLVSGVRYANNQELSQARSEYVRSRLIEFNKISQNRIIAIGRGELYPASDNRTEEGRKKNRRFEITILKTAAES